MGTTILVASPADQYAGEISSHYPSEQPARRKSLGRPRMVDRRTGLLGSCRARPHAAHLEGSTGSQGGNAQSGNCSSFTGPGVFFHSDVGYERVAAVYRWP